MAVTPRPPLTVAGDCPKCRTHVETTAPKGRTTWRGPCPTVGCGAQIMARRKPVPPAGAAAPPAPPAGRTGRRKITKVAAYDRPDPEPGAKPPGEAPPVRSPAGGPPAGDGDAKPLPEGQHTGKPTADGDPPPAGKRPKRQERSETGHRRSPYPGVYDW